MRTTDACFLPNQQTHRKSASLINDCIFFTLLTSRGGGLPLYRPCRCVPPQRVGFFALFLGLKTRIDFPHFTLESGKSFRGNYGSE